VGGTSYNIQWLSDDNVSVSTHDVVFPPMEARRFRSPLPLAWLATHKDLAGRFRRILHRGARPRSESPRRMRWATATAAASGLISIIGSGFTANSSATYTYDALNRLTQAVLSDGRTIQYTWDSAGNLVAIVVTGQ